MIQAANDAAPRASLRWCVATTKRGEEKLAVHCLEALARRQPAVVEVYLPMVLGHPRSRNPIQPMFPRHVFVRIDLASNGWNAIFTTRYVQTILRAGDRPGWIENRRIEIIRAEEEGGYVQLRDEPIPQWEAVVPKADETWEPGARVSVEDLPWEAVFNRHLDGRRVELLVFVLGSDSKPAKAVRDLSELRRAPSA
jgi:transcription antitermination factor NusG